MEFIGGRWINVPYVFLEEDKESMMETPMKHLMFAQTVMTGMIICGDLANLVRVRVLYSNQDMAKHPLPLLK